jgi:DNA integrity scanning protein DisA with diadenylate cyclase activity
MRLDIAIVALITYRVLKMIRGTRALQILLGLALYSCFMSPVNYSACTRLTGCCPRSWEV